MKQDWTTEELEILFSMLQAEATNLMLKKNRDYGNSWALDRPTTITDTMRHKLDRIRSLEDMRNRGETPSIETEGIRAELLDIINYACFRLIMENEVEFGNASYMVMPTMRINNYEVRDDLPKQE